VTNSATRAGDVCSRASCKVGPGKTLLGGIDQTTDAYRGFRADRIEYLVDRETGEIIRRNVLDWLLERAARQEKARRAEAKRAA
jgi:hypothetical protein